VHTGVTEVMARFVGVRSVSVSPTTSIMSQHFKRVNRDPVSIAREVIALLLWVSQRLLRMLFRRPLIDKLALLLALWLITTFLDRVIAPQPVLLLPAAVFEGR